VPPRITVVGSANIDHVARCERLPRPGETVTDAVFERVPGGKGANQAVAAARLGATVRFVGRIGTDDLVLRSLDREGIDTSAVARDDGETGVALILVAVLHFIEDHEDPWAVVNCYKDLMAPGSYLVISHVTADHLSADAARQARAAYAGASAPGAARSRAQIAGFFAGLDMVPPGLVDVSEWRPDVIGVSAGPPVFYAGIGCKTRPGRPR